MAIITKPVGGILKGVPASISLSKSELSALSIIVADSYFSNTSNWNKVILKYRSSTGKQYEAVQFDATLSSPTGNFLVSIKARDAFQIQTIEIHDFDNDIFIVPRSALNVADFDVVLLSAPSSLSYSTPVTYTQNTAITNNVPTVTGTVTSYSILPALPAGLNLNTTTGVISGTPTEVSAAANYVVTASNGAGSITATINITVEAEEVPVSDPIIWDTFLNGSTPQADGGISGGTSGAIVKSNASKAENGADFKFTFNFTRGPANDSYDYLWGIMPSTANTGFTGWTGVTLQSSNSILIYDNYSGSGAHTASFTNGMIVDGPNTSEFEKIGNVLTIKMNGVTIYTKNNYTEQTSVPMVRLWQGEQVLDSAYAEIQQVVVGDPILWQSKPGYIIEADGGATATSERPSYGEYYRVFAPSSQWVTGDFTFEAEINNAWQGNDYIGFYDSDTNFTMTTGFNGSQVRYEQSTPANYVKPAGDTYTLKMQRTGYVLKFYVNDVEVYSVTQANLSTVKVPFFTFTDSTKHIVSATLLLPTATNYINWDLLTGYQAGSLTITPTSGVSGGISLAGNDVAVKSDADKATGDFDYTFKFDWSAATSVVDMFAGVTGNNVTAGTSPLFYDRLTCIYGNGNNPDTAYLWHNGLPVGGTTQTLLSGVNTYRLKRVGTTITHYLNDVQIYSAISNSFTAYPSVRTMGNSVVTESYITQAPISVTWNVAGKTGVGTVTTGANGLITKTTGGNGYNVNVLSNETITGDGYVEFINSSSFINVVFGLAEVNSPSGSYDQIIYGTYVAQLGTYERVEAGQALGNMGIGVVSGDVVRIQRTGTTFSILRNGSVMNTVTINNTNPLKASVSIYGETLGINNVTISE